MQTTTNLPWVCMKWMKIETNHQFRRQITVDTVKCVHCVCCVFRGIAHKVGQRQCSIVTWESVSEPTVEHCEWIGVKLLECNPCYLGDDNGGGRQCNVIQRKCVPHNGSRSTSTLCLRYGAGTRQGPRLSIRIDIWILPSDTETSVHYSWIGRRQCYLAGTWSRSTFTLCLRYGATAGAGVLLHTRAGSEDFGPWA